MPKAVEVLDAAKFYRVDKATLAAALPRQMPQVDLTKGGDKGMEIAIADMMHARLHQDAAAIIDTTCCASARLSRGRHRDAARRRHSGRGAAPAAPLAFWGKGFLKALIPWAGR